MTKFWQISLLLGIIMSFLPQTGNSQNIAFLKPVRVNGGSYVSINDSLVYFQNDTVIYVSDSYLPQDTGTYNKTLVFYDSLKARAERKGFTKLLYDLVVVPPSKPDSSIVKEKSVESFTSLKGKTIRHIIYKRLNAFGSTLTDPETSLKNEKSYFLNNTHIKTRQRIIRNYLLFEETDSLEPLKISESERLLRKLSYIYDARIVAIPVSNEEVDVMVITKDVYSLGLETDIKSLKVGKVSALSKNLFGLGHELEINTLYDYEVYNSTGFGASYKLKNIGRTLIDATFKYQNAFNIRNTGLNISRDFLTAYTKYAGGLSLNETYVLEDLDTLVIPEPIQFTNFDIWLGRSYLIDKSSFTRAVISGRYIRNNVWRKPDLSENSYYEYQKYDLYLASFSLVSQQFYKSNLIYNYGRSEDIPYGGILALTYGKEYNEVDIRDYISVESAFGGMLPGNGYMYGRVLLSTFTRDNTTEQGQVQMDLKYISDLYDLNSFKLRLFSNINYTRGFYRYDNEYLSIGEGYGIRGFKNDSLFPTQRIYLNLEAVAFSKAFFYGFRFAVFGFADMVLFSDNELFYKYDNFVSGFGIGLRVRNNNLIFNTFEIRFGVYPGAPPYSNISYLNISGERLLNPPGFDPHAPSVSRFR